MEKPSDEKISALLKDKTVLVTGGTGSFGRKFVEIVLSRCQVAKLIVFSRDELKQHDMAKTIHDERIRFFLGDIRNRDRLKRALNGVDYVIHAAALKQVPTLEYNPFEAVLTNILGSQNVIDGAIDSGVKKVIALSTDKAVSPINLYGATKLCAEKLFISGNVYAGHGPARFGVVRYGNVVGSRGSVIPVFLAKRKTGVLPITDKRMTRFWLTLEQGVMLVLRSLARLQGGEIYVPKIPSMKITELAKAVAPECEIKYVGIRPGEKIHEDLLTEEEATRTKDLGDCYMIAPAFDLGGVHCPPYRNNGNGGPFEDGFKYSSDRNKEWVSPEQLAEMLGSPS